MKLDFGCTRRFHDTLFCRDCFLKQGKACNSKSNTEQKVEICTPNHSKILSLSSNSDMFYASKWEKRRASVVHIL